MCGRACSPTTPPDAEHGGSAPHAFEVPSTCADATQNTTPITPPATAYVSQSSPKIKLKDPKYDPLKEIAGKKVADVKSLQKGIVLKKLPSGTYKISVTATTVLDQRLSGSQTYKSCTKGSGNIKLKKVKHHHG